MGPVVGNTERRESGVVTWDDYNQIATVPLTTGGLEPSRFEGGMLVDVWGGLFCIAGNGPNEVWVHKSAGGSLPQSNASVIFWDDDFLLDGEQVPAPDCSMLAGAMAEAYITVLYDVDYYYISHDLPFVLNMQDAAFATQAQWGSGANGAVTEGWWGAYVVGAFQYKTTQDNDPNSEHGPVLFDCPYGICAAEYGCWIFLENSRDLSREHNQDPVLMERNAVVHEVGHAVARSGDDVDVTSWDGRYTEEYLLRIRSTQKPYSL